MSRDVGPFMPWTVHTPHRASTTSFTLSRRSSSDRLRRLSLDQFEGFGGTSMCKVVLCFYYRAQDGHRNHCPTIHPDKGVSPLWFMPPVDSILKGFLDTPVQQDFHPTGSQPSGWGTLGIL